MGANMEPKISLKLASVPQGRSEASLCEPFGPCWPHVGVPGGFISSILSVLFEARARSARQSKNTLRNDWSKGLVLGWPAFGGSKRNHDEGVHAFSGQDFLVYESNWPPRRVFSHVGPQKPLVFMWFRAFHAFLRPPVAPRGQKSHEMLFEITCQKVLQDSCGTEAHKGHGSVAGLGALAPLEIRPLSL